MHPLTIESLAKCETKDLTLWLFILVLCRRVVLRTSGPVMIGRAATQWISLVVMLQSLPVTRTDVRCMHNIDIG